ncbi:MAG TPA: hypothetical protein VHJ20_03310 [Polyangia bacterium]|nr:hypothetical protein [Polyangia bacterium]
MLTLAFGAGCTHGVTETRLPAHENPTAWSFARPLDAVAACLRSATFTADAWEHEAKRALGTDVDHRADGSYAVELESDGYGREVVRSETYLRRACPLGLYGRWRVEAAAQPGAASSDAATRVEVRPLALSLHNYDCSYIGHPAGCAIDAKSSTVEEYRMLLALGACLGVTDMPPVVRPAGAAPRLESCQEWTSP